MVSPIVAHTTLPACVVVAEWLRRWTRNPLGSPRAGSNPADYDLHCPFLTPGHALPHVLHPGRPPRDIRPGGHCQPEGKEAGPFHSRTRPLLPERRLFPAPCSTAQPPPCWSPPGTRRGRRKRAAAPPPDSTSSQRLRAAGRSPRPSLHGARSAQLLPRRSRESGREGKKRE